MEAILETFKPVRGYEGMYEASDCGCVRSLNYHREGKVKYLRNAKRHDGYEAIRLYRDGKPKMFSVHRLVWETFVGKIPDGYEIDHINTIRDDNRLSNLRVVTRKGNMANPISVERNREGNRKVRNKPVLQLDKQTGEVIREWECTADVERELGIYSSSISACCLGKRNSAGGFKWRFVSD